MLAVAWWDHGAVPIALLFSYAALLSLCMVLDGTSRAALIHDVLSAGAIWEASGGRGPCRHTKTSGASGGYAPGVVFRMSIKGS